MTRGPHQPGPFGSRVRFLTIGSLWFPLPRLVPAGRQAERHLLHRPVTEVARG